MGRKNDLDLLDERPMLPGEANLSEVKNDTTLELIASVDAPSNLDKFLTKTDKGRLIVLSQNGTEITGIGSGDHKKRIAHDFSKAATFAEGDYAIIQAELIPSSGLSVYTYTVQANDSSISDIIQGLITAMTSAGLGARYNFSEVTGALVIEGVNAYDDYIEGESRFEKTITTAFSFLKSLPYGDVPTTSLSHLGASRSGAVDGSEYKETINIAYDPQLNTQQFLGRSYKILIDDQPVCNYTVPSGDISPDFETTIVTIKANISGQLNFSSGLITDFDSVDITTGLTEYIIIRSTTTPWNVFTTESGFSQAGMIEYDEVLSIAGPMLPSPEEDDLALGFSFSGNGNDLNLLTDGDPLTVATFPSDGTDYIITVDTNPLVLGLWQMKTDGNELLGVKISGSDDNGTSYETLWDDSAETFTGDIRLPVFTASSGSPYDKFKIEFGSNPSGADIEISRISLFTSSRKYIALNSGDDEWQSTDWDNGKITDHEDVEKPINPSLGNTAFGFLEVEGTITNPAGMLNSDFEDPSILGPDNSSGTYATEAQMIGAIHTGKTSTEVDKGIYTISDKSQYRVEYHEDKEAIISDVNFFYETTGGSPIPVNPVPIKKLNDRFTGGYAPGVQKSVSFKVATTSDTEAFNLTDVDGNLSLVGMDDYLIVKVISPSTTNDYTRRLQKFGGPLMNQPGGPSVPWLGNNLSERYGTIISKTGGDTIEVGEYTVTVEYHNVNGASAFAEQYLKIEGGGVIYETTETPPPAFVADPIKDVFEVRIPSTELPFFKTFDLFTITIPAESGQVYTYSPSADGLSLADFFTEFAAAINSGAAGGAIPTTATVTAQPNYLKIEDGRDSGDLTVDVFAIGTALNVNTKIVSIPNPLSNDVLVNNEIATFLDLQNPLRDKEAPFFTSLESNKTRSLNNFSSINDIEKAVVTSTKTDKQLIVAQTTGSAEDSLTHDFFISIELQPAAASVGFRLTDSSFNNLSMVDFENVTVTAKMKTTSGEKIFTLTEDLLRNQFHDISGLNSIFSDSYEGNLEISIIPTSIGEFSYPEIRLGELTHGGVSEDGYIFFKNDIEIVEGDVLIYELSAEGKRYSFALDPLETHQTNLTNFVNSINAGTAGSPAPTNTVFLTADPFSLGFPGIGVDFVAAGWTLRHVNAALVRMSTNKVLTSSLLIASEFPRTISQLFINASVASIEGLRLEATDSSGLSIGGYLIDQGGFEGNAGFIATGPMTSPYFKVTFEHNLASSNSEINALSFYEELKLLTVSDYPEPYDNATSIYKFQSIAAHNIPFSDNSVNKYGSIGNALDKVIDRLAENELTTISNTESLSAIQSQGIGDLQDVGSYGSSQEAVTNAAGDAVEWKNENSIKVAYTAATSFTTLLTHNVILANAGSNDVDIDLPTPSASFVGGRSSVFIIKRLDGSGNAVNISGNGGNIDGSATKVLSSQLEKVTVISDGTDYWTI